MPTNCFIARRTNNQSGCIRMTYSQLDRPPISSFCPACVAFTMHLRLSARCAQWLSSNSELRNPAETRRSNLNHGVIGRNVVVVRSPRSSVTYYRLPPAESVLLVSSCIGMASLRQPQKSDRVALFGSLKLNIAVLLYFLFSKINVHNIQHFGPKYL
jgi:hypothetical protein